MATLNMTGPYPLTTEKVNELVEDKIGNYAFGRMDGNTFYVEYVGRSDSRLCSEIKQQGGLHHKLDIDGYYFYYSYAANITEAYEKECQNYHDFGGRECLENEYHPAKPTDNNHYHCPVEGCPEHEDK